MTKPIRNIAFKKTTTYQKEIKHLRGKVEHWRNELKRMETEYSELENQDLLLRRTIAALERDEEDKVKELRGLVARSNDRIDKLESHWLVKLFRL